MTLPGRHLQAGYYDLAWGDFDVALAALLVATGIGLLRRKLWVQSTATAAATMPPPATRPARETVEFLDGLRLSTT